MKSKMMIEIKNRKLLLALLVGIVMISYAVETTGQDHTLSSRRFQGIPSLAITPEGRLWATWYAGITPGEDQNNYVVVATSGDGGKTWKENLIIDPDPDGPVRAFDPELWLDPEGRLWSFWAQTIGHDGTIAGVWARINNDPDRDGSKWSQPRRLTDGIMMCKPTVLSSGEWILPASTWRDTDNSARVVVSADKGQTFSIRGACNVPREVRNYDEHMIIERKDRSLWMLVRTSYGIGESISKDQGKTWSTLTPSSIQHPSARFFIRRLQSGNLLLVKHGAVNERTGRSHLTAYVSEDDGLTWSGGLLLDERSGVSYPDGQQRTDGTIHIIYDYSRTGDREILMATFTEEDVMAGDPTASSVSLRMVVSKYEGINDETKIFAKNPIQVIQSLYLDPEGMPSHDVFLKTHGLYPIKSTIQSTPYFTVSFLKDEVLKKNGEFKPGKSAALLNPDFYMETTTLYKSTHVAVPVWDGRVYQDKNDLIVGGYSSKFNERPVGTINNKGLFNPQSEGVNAEEFPILELPAGQLIFDPFEWKLLGLKQSSGETIQKSVSSFLPIKIYGPQGEVLNNISFELERVPASPSLVLYGIIDGKKIEVASCALKDSDIVKRKEAFQPEMIQGCSQPGNGEIITLTFQGTYSDNIAEKDSDLYLKTESEAISEEYKSKPNTIEIDGYFQDWRNIDGVKDVNGDHVSYLYANPDTDLLEFKISNDEKYLYLYSRVVGAHGRTGEKGRYYWYAYIDVDRDASTGYPPTRDDNCYFGIAIGDDCEAQFEFVGDRFVKTFFGFTGIGAEKEVLSGELKLGPSYYAPTGKDGKKRESYKIEYVNRDDSRFITHDYTEGTSEDIIIALSPDGSEVEVKVELAGFLKDTDGKMLMYRGKKIDIAVGVEGSSDYYGSDDWGADSSPVIYGYTIK
ncbi:MAG: sialidase family protein [Bacteroidota bacterium]|nr:sialidase family protein [Bacteroidota bacterium]